MRGQHPLEPLPTPLIHKAEVSESMDGVDYVEDYWDRSKRTFSPQYVIESDDATYFGMMRDLEHRLHGIAVPVWFVDPTERKHERVYCGLGTGTRTTFIVPFNGLSSAPTIVVDGVDETTPGWEQQANLFTDAQAIPSSATGFTAVAAGGTLALSDAHAYLGRYALKRDPAGSVAGYGIQSPVLSGITVGRYYTGLAFVHTALSAMKARINWLDSGGSPLSSSAGGSITISGDWICVYVRAVAPASAAKATLDVYFDGTDTKAFWASCWSLGASEDYDWYLPSSSPGVAILSAAPEDEAVVEATAWAKSCTKCRCKEQPTSSYDAMGNLEIKFDITEVW